MSELSLKLGLKVKICLKRRAKLQYAAKIREETQVKYNEITNILSHQRWICVPSVILCFSFLCLNFGTSHFLRR